MILFFIIFIYFFLFYFYSQHFLLIQIAAKIGGDAGTSMNSNDYGYGGQKRPLEDGGMHSLLLLLFLLSVPRCQKECRSLFVVVVFFHSTA